MQTDDFEKQVQQKMEELLLQPSDRVWTEVEKEIREKKRRRIPVLWILFFLVVGGIFISLIDTNNTHDKRKSATTHNFNNKKEAISNIDSLTKLQKEISTVTTTSNKPSAGDSNHPKTNRAISDPSKKEKITDTDFLIRSKQKRNKPYAATALIKHIKKESGLEKSPQAAKELEIVDSVRHKDEQEKSIATTETEQPLTGKKNVFQDSNFNKSVREKMIDEKVVEKNDTLSNTAAKKKKGKQAWEFGFNITMGLSNRIDSKVKKETLLYNAFDNTNNNSSAPSTAFSSNARILFVPRTIRSSPKIGASLGLDIFAKKKISKKTSLRLGLTYNYFSNRIAVGEEYYQDKMLSNSISGKLLVSSYYKLPRANNLNYRTNYHILAATGTFSWRFLQHKIFSIDWDNGFSFGRLLNSNHLFYDEDLNGYYKDFSSLNKTQIFVSSGFASTILKTNHFSTLGTIGLQYGLSSLQKEGESNHLVNYSLGLRFIFHKK